MPVLRTRAEDMQRAAIFGAARLARLILSPSALLTANHVGEFDQALLDALQFVAGAGEHQRQEKIGHVTYRGLGLPDPDGFHQHDVKACGLAQQHRLAGFSQQPPRACREAGEGRMKACCRRTEAGPLLSAAGIPAGCAPRRVHREIATDDLWPRSIRNIRARRWWWIFPTRASR